MLWQDIVITIVGIGFSYSLIPQIIKNHKTKDVKSFSYQTLIITTIGMFILGIMMLTMKLYISTSIDFVTGILWFIILHQKLHYDLKG